MVITNGSDAYGETMLLSSRSQSHRHVAAQTLNTPPPLAEQGTATSLPLQLSPLWSALLLDKIC